MAHSATHTSPTPTTTPRRRTPTFVTQRNQHPRWRAPPRRDQPGPAAAGPSGMPVRPRTGPPPGDSSKIGSSPLAELRVLTLRSLHGPVKSRTCPPSHLKPCSRA